MPQLINCYEFIHETSQLSVVFYIFWFFGTVGFNILFGNRAAGPGGVREVASVIISHEQT